MQLYTEKALAKALGLTIGEVESLRKSGAISYRKGTSYAIDETAAAIIDHCKRRWGETKDQTADYQTERALLMRAKRQEQEFETRLREKELHEAADVEQIVTTMLLNFRSRVMAIPSRMAARLAKESDTTEIFNILKEATDDALNELSDYDTLFGNETDTEEN